MLGLLLCGLLPSCATFEDAPATRLPETKSLDKGVRLAKVMMPMRDGIRLATHIYFPDGNGPWPVVLIRTPYGKGGEAINWEGRQLLDRGILLAIQDPRGRFESEGKSTAFGDDINDGYDAVEWIASQPWCTGKVGTYGRSGPGITQYMMALSAPPHLACQHIGIASSDPYMHGVFQGGAYRESLCDNWIEKNGYDLAAHKELFARHSSRDDYWDNHSAVARAADVNSPIIHWSGYWDMFCQAAIDAFVAIQAHGGPNARGKQKLVIGPWSHGIQRNPGELLFPENALLVPNMDEWAWFDYHLKGIDSDLIKQSAVAYYVMAASEAGAPGNYWRTLDSWPPPSKPVSWFLHKDKSLSPEPPKETIAKLSYDYDPNNPVRTIGGAELFLPKGSFDMRRNEERDDVLVFTSEPLTEPLEVTGRVSAKLFVSSSAPDTDFTAMLCDVYPDGRSMLLLDGIKRARYRYSDRFESMMTPGNVYELDVDLWTTSIIFNKGHRIRVSISSSNFPRFDANPNTGLPWNSSEEAVTATNTLHLSADYPSNIILPVYQNRP